MTLTDWEYQLRKREGFLQASSPQAKDQWLKPPTENLNNMTRAWAKISITVLSMRDFLNLKMGGHLSSGAALSTPPKYRRRCRFDWRDPKRSFQTSKGGVCWSSCPCWPGILCRRLTHLIPCTRHSSLRQSGFSPMEGKKYIINLKTPFQTGGSWSSNLKNYITTFSEVFSKIQKKWNSWLGSYAGWKGGAIFFMYLLKTAVNSEFNTNITCSFCMWTAIFKWKLLFDRLQDG